MNSTTPLNSADKCRICDKQTSRNNPLHSVSTLVLDARVRRCASTLQDEKLLGKLSAGDLVALEVNCDASCLALLYKRAVMVGDEEIREQEGGENLRRHEGIYMQNLFLMSKSLE